MIGCKYCKAIQDSSQNEQQAKYRESTYANVYIGRALNRPALYIEQKGCPKYADCCAKDEPIISVFFINYCPNCGAKMDEEEPDV